MKSCYAALKLPYHYLLALLGAVIFGFPSRKLNVIAVTGTKGKSSVVELVSALLEEAGFATTLANTIRFKIRGDSRPNLYKMTMPGRFFLQHFLRRAVHAGCTHAVIETTSEGARQFRHKFIALDALIFTNLAPEHIESHGSYENYAAAKVSLAKALEKSRKKNRVLVVNGDDREAQRFLDAFSGTKVVYAKRDAKNPIISSEGVAFNWSGARISSKLPGEFNLYNILAAISYARAAGVPVEKIKAGIEKVRSLRGRAEEITLEDAPRTEHEPRTDLGSEERSVLGQTPVLGQTRLDFKVVVDYAHTPDSLEKLYQTYSGKYRICVLGNTGGGRDKWKRPVMAGIAETYCDEIILTNEDPYDEDPEQIIREMAAGMKHKQPTLILNRRAAIRAALEKASRGDVVLITGKGTDPFIMGPHGSKEPWDDATVAREELKTLLNSNK
ncbi:MAG: Mur ligase family protein [Patescibacteria group bacterium]